MDGEWSAFHACSIMCGTRTYCTYIRATPATQFYDRLDHILDILKVI